MLQAHLPQELLSASCGQGMLRAQHGAVSHLYMQHSMGLGLLGLAVMWVTYTCKGLLVIITAFCLVIHIHFTFPKDVTSYTLH